MAHEVAFGVAVALASLGLLTGGLWFLRRGDPDAVRSWLVDHGCRDCCRQHGGIPDDADWAASGE